MSRSESLPLFQNSPFILLDHTSDETGASYLYQNPVDIFAPKTKQELEEMLIALENGLKNGYFAAGYFTFEAGIILEPSLEDILKWQGIEKLAFFGLFKKRSKLDQSGVQSFLNDLEKEQKKFFKCDSKKQFPSPNPKQTLKNYTPTFNQVKDYIKDGDVYQINLTFKAKFKVDEPAPCLYQKLKSRQMVPFGAFIHTCDEWVLSASPELFIRLKNGTLTTKPMKGTINRAPSLKEDKKRKRILKNDLKTRAENLMIVDLMRNDFARICRPGTVKTSNIFAIETYETLHQMTTTIKGKLEKELSLPDFIKALLPVGSITGAPKIRATQRILELEREPRGIYTGIIGHFTPHKKHLFNAHFNVAIRTVELDKIGNGQIGIGGGIVADSILQDEYDEALLKMSFLTRPAADFSLIETMGYRANKAQISYLDDHLTRLKNSADYFHRPCPIDVMKQDLKTKLAKCNEDQRVRLLLNKDGSFKIETAPLTPLLKDQTHLKIAIAKENIHSANCFFYHKTTNRSFYDDTRQSYKAKHGIDEIIFLNERGELTEGSFTNLFLKIDGTLLTPHQSAGLLPGILRKNLLKTKQAKEAILTCADLDKAEAIYLGNALRGLMKAKIIG